MNVPEGANHRKRVAKAAVAACMYVIAPLLGLGLAALLDYAGLDVLPRPVDSYAGAQGVGYIAFALLATVGFLIGPWIAAAWYLRRDRRCRARTEATT